MVGRDWEGEIASLLATVANTTQPCKGGLQHISLCNIVDFGELLVVLTL